jgi:hypothetical protein
MLSLDAISRGGSGASASCSTRRTARTSSLAASTARPGAGGAAGDDLAIEVGQHALQLDVLAVGVSVLAEQDGE